MFININDVLINYEIYGEGKPLLILHGWGACINAMAPIWQFFKQKFKVYVLDFPGQQNGSGDPKTPWGIPEYACLILEFMKKLEINKPHVIAHSFGGRVAIYLSSLHKELFNKIVLVDSAGIKSKVSIKKQIKIYMFKCGKAILKYTSSKDKYDERLKNLRKKFGSSDYSNIKSDIVRQTFSKVINLDLTNNLKDIERPVLLMWGENDTDTPLYMAKIMEKNIHDSGLVVLKDAGHFSYIDKSNEFNLIVDNFLS